MSMLYPCPECDGLREVQCSECGALLACTHCKETGRDPEHVDIEKWYAAERDFDKRHGATCSLFSAGCDVGRRTWDGANVLELRDFLGEP